MREKPVTEFRNKTLEIAYIEHLRWLSNNLRTADDGVFHPRMRRASVLSAELGRRGIKTESVEQAHFSRLRRVNKQV